MDSTLVAGWLGFVGGVIVAVGGAMWAFIKLEHNERRRLRVECVVSLMGARFTLDGKEMNPEDKARFNVELNKIPALFADDDAVMHRYRVFAQSGDIQKIYPLIHALMQSVKIGKNLEQDDIERVLRA